MDNTVILNFNKVVHELNVALGIVPRDAMEEAVAGVAEAHLPAAIQVVAERSNSTLSTLTSYTQDADAETDAITPIGNGYGEVAMVRAAATVNINLDTHHQAVQEEAIETPRPEPKKGCCFACFKSIFRR